MTVAERLALPWLHPGRADVIGAGALILSRVLRRTPVEDLVVSEADILDGIAWSLRVLAGRSGWGTAQRMRRQARSHEHPADGFEADIERQREAAGRHRSTSSRSRYRYARGPTAKQAAVVAGVLAIVAAVVTVVKRRRS